MKSFRLNPRLKLDPGSIRTSPRDGLSTPYRKTKEKCRTVPLCPSAHALNLSILDASILMIVQQVCLMMFPLTMVDYSMSFLLLSSKRCCWWTSRGDHSKMFLLFQFCGGTPPSCLKVMGGGWWWPTAF